MILESFDSAVLRGNPLGDPSVRSVLVYLPPDYDQSTRRYPVIFCLAGFTGTSWSFINFDAFAPTLPQRFERLIDGGKSAPAILVMVDAMTTLGGNQYINSDAVGRYEDHIISELVPFIDARYRTLGAGHRGVKGKSSGGYGAVMHGLRHPDIWSAVACHSGDMYFDYCYLPDFPGAIDGIRSHGGLEAWFKARLDKPKIGSEDFKPINIVAMAAFYSPSAGAEMGIDLPFDLDSGAIRSDVWARWLDHDPVRIVERHAEALGSLKLLYIDCGTKDQFNLHHGARILTRKLKELNVRHEYEEFDDNHTSVQYRYDVSLPKLIAALS